MSSQAGAPRVIVKKKRAKHAAHHGGAWKVAYADFVTAMMALFMVLWLLTQADMQLRSQIAQYFRDPGILPGGSVVSKEVNPAQSREPNVVEKDIILVHSKKAKQAERERDEAAASEQRELEAQASAIEREIERAAAGDPALRELREQVIIQVTPAGLTIQVVDRHEGEKLLFDISSSELKPPLVALLGRIAAVLGRMPNDVLVGGHTDSRPYAATSTKTNWELSFERADAARRVLEASGLRAGQVKRILAYADSEPLVPEDPLADMNRRLSIVAARREAVPAAAGPGDIVHPPDRLPEARATLKLAS